MSFAVLNKLSVVIKKTLLFYFFYFFKDDPGFSITFKMKNKTPNCERMINALLTASANKAECRVENMKDERTVSERWTHDGRINNAQLADRKRTKQYDNQKKLWQKVKTFKLFLPPGNVRWSSYWPTRCKWFTVVILFRWQLP